MWMRFVISSAARNIKLKAQHTEITDVQRALENVHNQYLDSEFKWKLKFDEAAALNKQCVERLRFENAGLRKALDETCQYLERLKRAQRTAD